MSRIAFFIAEAFRALRRNAAPSVAAIVTIIITTLLLGVLIPVLKASASKTEDVRSQLALRVFLYVDATKSETKSVQHKLQDIRHVSDVEYISRTEALSILGEQVGKGPLREGINQLNGKNPLPPAFNVYPDNPDNLDSISSAVTPPGANGKPKPISKAIEETSTRQEANKIRSVTGAVKIILGVIAGLLLIASLMLVANTIRLSIYARRREVEVMRLVGATNWFIRWPFVLEGLIVGISGALVAVGVLWLGKVTIVDPLADSFSLVNNFSTVGFVPLMVALIGAATAVSALGSGITLRRFLRV